MIVLIPAFCHLLLQGAVKLPVMADLFCPTINLHIVCTETCW